MKSKFSFLSLNDSSSTFSGFIELDFLFLSKHIAMMKKTIPMMFNPKNMYMLMGFYSQIKHLAQLINEFSCLHSTHPKQFECSVGINTLMNKTEIVITRMIVNIPDNIAQYSLDLYLSFYFSYAYFLKSSYFFSFAYEFGFMKFFAVDKIYLNFYLMLEFCAFKG